MAPTDGLALYRLGPPHVTIPAERTITADSVTLFCVEVTPAGGSEPWSMHRRYSDFMELRTVLGLMEDSLPGAPFPPKHFFSCTGEKLERRRAGLETWLRHLLTEPSCLHVAQQLCRFLADTPLAQAAPLRASYSLFPGPGGDSPSPSELSRDASAASDGQETSSELSFAQSSSPLRRRLSSIQQRLRQLASEVTPADRAARWRQERAASWSEEQQVPTFSSMPAGAPTRHSFAAVPLVRDQDVGVERAPGAGGDQEESFAECARLISRDIPRTFHGNPSVDRVRLHIAEILRAHARKDPELGYTQGMCFAAAATCLTNSSVEEASVAFEGLMARLRGLWLPGFPMVVKGIPLFQDLLQERDPEVVQHLQHLGLDLEMLLPKAWLTLFARWLPLPSVLEALPFLAREGLPGVLAITLLLLLYHRWFIMGCQSLEEAFLYLGSLPTKPPPDRLIDMGHEALPCLQARMGSLDI